MPKITDGGRGAMDYQAIINTGFAIVVAWYVLTRLEPAIKQLDRTVGLLTVIVAKSSGMDYEQIRREYHGDREERS